MEIEMEKSIAEILAVQNDAASEHRKNFNILCAVYPELGADWKGPISAKFNSAKLANKMKAAVEFMTGAPAIVTEISEDEYRLECIGYRAGPCGDH
jgi:hypothetical protein